jgi:hypothetical protein
LLRELAKYNPLIRENLAAETAQDAQNQERSSAEEGGSVKRRRIIDDDEQEADVDMAVVRKIHRQAQIAEYERSIWENRAKAQEAMAKAREVVASCQTNSGKILLDFQEQLLQRLKNPLSREKCEQYMNRHNDMLAMRLCENTCRDPFVNKPPAKRAITDSTGDGDDDMTMPDLVREGQPLLISSILAERGLRDDEQHSISKAVGVIAARIYREKRGKEPNKSAIVLNNNMQVQSNAYIEADREILVAAVDEYMENHDTSGSKTRTQRAREAAEKETKTQTKLNFRKT